ncbi:MAG: DUF4062 domain-containing protein [Acidobacteria bacterium]|nr:DUF4062 domain-containing protein [Acidobacteriota bacterium]
MANAAQGFAGVMVSSTFTDLKEHRKVLREALGKLKLHPVAMEDSAPKTIGVLDSSLEMVRESRAYICVIGKRYGWVPEDEGRNPAKISVTELELNEAVRLELPVLVFLMGKNHHVLEEDVELDAEKRKKLEAFRERVRNRWVCPEFNSIEEFLGLVYAAVADWPRGRESDVAVEKARGFKAVPPYLASNEFVGRRAQLDVLNDWASAADPHPVLLFDAIGGTGKSMLTWEWARKHAPKVRSDWAGRFWYSFYERGAVMADFCRQALAYMTGRRVEEFGKLATAELSDLLLSELQARPWLLVLDGLERVLVMYHRFDAAQVTEEEANAPTDQIAQRDPCLAIRDEDDTLLRSLAMEGPSKVLITSRLVPRVLVNRANQPVPGVLRVTLPGLRPVDAEELVMSLGIRGDSEAIQNYLKSNCDCHPLVIGVLAGLIQNYLPDQGNFDAWVKEMSLDLGTLDLRQKQNHILQASLKELSAKSRAVLGTMALLTESVDYLTLSALVCDGELGVTIPDLQRRGLLQYDGSTKRYDLHPVVRSVASDQLKADETESYGQRLVDHFSSQQHDPWMEAETLEDVRMGLNLVRTLLKLGRYQAAATAFRGDMSRALFFNLNANAEVLMLLKPFFPQGWGKLSAQVNKYTGSYLLNQAGVALSRLGAREEALEALAAALVSDLLQRDLLSLATRLHNLSVQLPLGQRDRCLRALLGLEELLGDREGLFSGLRKRFGYVRQIGRYHEAELLWGILDPMGREWSKDAHRPGGAEGDFAWARFCQGTLEEKALVAAEDLARGGKSGDITIDLHYLRGLWCVEKGDWEHAMKCFGAAVTMDRAVNGNDPRYATCLALAKFQRGQLPEASMEAEHLANAKRVAHQPLAELWLVLGDREKATHHALQAYREAWADGEPYVYRWELNKAKALLEKLGVEPPVLPQYDPEKDGKYPYEDEVNAAIAELRAQKGKK